MPLHNINDSLHTTLFYECTCAAQTPYGIARMMTFAAQRSAFSKSWDGSHIASFTLASLMHGSLNFSEQYISR